MGADPTNEIDEPAALQVDAVLDVVLSSAGRLFDGDGGSIMLLVGPEELEVVCAPANNAALGARVRFGEGVAGKVAASQDPALVSGRAGARRQAVDSAMSVPLLHQGRIFGVLNINAAAGRRYSEHDLAAATEFGGHAADALAEARLYEVGRREGTDRPERHLDELLRHLAIAAKVDFPEPRVPEDLDLAALAREVAETETAAGRVTDVRGPSSVMVKGVATYLRRAIVELVANGHLHGDRPVRLVLESLSRKCHLTVADAGPGLPTSQRRLVFEPFGRLDHSAALPGLGLGLPIAQRLVEAAGGELDVDETPVGGAAFRISLDPA